MLSDPPAAHAEDRGPSFLGCSTGPREVLAKVGNRLSTRPIESLCDTFFVFYSFWTVTWIVCYFSNLSFSAICPIFVLLLPLSVLPLALKPSEAGQPESRRDTLSVLGFVIAGILLTLF